MLDLIFNRRQFLTSTVVVLATIAGSTADAQSTCSDIFAAEISRPLRPHSDFEIELAARLRENRFQIGRTLQNYLRLSHPDLQATLAHLDEHQVILDSGAGAALFLKDYLRRDTIESADYGATVSKLPPLHQRANAKAISLNKPQDWQSDLNHDQLRKLDYHEMRVGEYAALYPHSVDVLVDLVGASAYAPVEFLNALPEVLKANGKAFFSLDLLKIVDRHDHPMSTTSFLSNFKGMTFDETPVAGPTDIGRAVMATKHGETVSIPHFILTGEPIRTPGGPIFTIKLLE